MGKYELDKKHKEDDVATYRKNKENSELFKKINRMTPKQKEKWIKEG